MAEETNPVKRTVDDIENLGKYLSILLVFFPTLAGHLANGNARDIWGLLALTMPFTATVALVTYFAMRGTFRISGLLVAAYLSLLALSLVSKWIGLGTDIDVGKFVIEHPSGNPVSLLWALLWDYFELYGAVTFCASLGCGLYLGYRYARAAEAKENAASELKKSAATGGK
jgi:hypothetical protein